LSVGYAILQLRDRVAAVMKTEWRDLGWGAVNHLRELTASGSDEIGAMITWQEGKLVPMPFGSFNDPETGKVCVRQVDVESARFKAARAYMIRLESEDLEDAEQLEALAAEAKITPAEFKDRFGYLA